MSQLDSSRADAADSDAGNLPAPEAVLEELGAQLNDQSLLAASDRDVWLFAYDLLLDQSTISRFIKGLQETKIVRLPHYRLEWPYFHRLVGTALPSLARSNQPADEVWGLLYECTGRDFDTLERYLRVPNRYRRTTVQVHDRGGRRIPAFTYVLSLRDDTPSLPARAYLDQLTATARERKLPEEWIAKLASAGSEG